MTDIKHKVGKTVLPGQEGYPDNGAGEIVIMLEGGEIMTNYVSIDYMADPDDVAQEINKLLVGTKGGSIVCVDCGDDHIYFYLEGAERLQRPIDEIIRELVECAEAPSNTDEFVGHVFRNFLSPIKAWGYPPIPQPAPRVPDWDRKISVTSLPKRFYEDLIVSFALEDEYKHIPGDVVNAIIKSHFSNKTASDLLGIWLDYEGLIGYNTTMQLLFNALHTRP